MGGGGRGRVRALVFGQGQRRSEHTQHTKSLNVTTLEEVGGKAGGKSFLGFRVVCTKP